MPVQNVETKNGLYRSIPCNIRYVRVERTAIWDAIESQYQVFTQALLYEVMPYFPEYHLFGAYIQEDYYLVAMCKGSSVFYSRN